MEYYCFNCKLIFNIVNDNELNCENCKSEFIEKYWENNINKPNNFKIYNKKEELNNNENINRTISFSFNHSFVRDTLYPLFQRNFHRSRINNLQRIELNFIRMFIESNLLLEDEISYKTSKKFIDELKMYKKLKNVEEECTICKENFIKDNNYNILPCKHEFHNKCLIPWLDIHYSCPNCRKELPKEEIKKED